MRIEIVAGLAALAAFFLGSSKTTEPEAEDLPVNDPNNVKPGEGPPMEAIAAGDPMDPEIAALLIQIDNMLASAGAGKYASARELLTMPKAPMANGRRPVAIPPVSLWQNMIPTLRAFDEIRAAAGVPIPIRGYRDREYNEAVGGADRSIHQWAGAIDMKLASLPVATREKIALLAARWVNQNPASKPGFGVYNDPPTTVHIDTGYKRRSWDYGADWLNRASSA
jgi:hypothetical protein